MKSKIENLIVDYKAKVASCDILIEYLKDQMSECRKRDLDSTLVRADLNAERTARQVAYQALVDLESLLETE